MAFHWMGIWPVETFYKLNQTWYSDIRLRWHRSPAELAG